MLNWIFTTVRSWRQKIVDKCLNYAPTMRYDGGFPYVLFFASVNCEIPSDVWEFFFLPSLIQADDFISSDNDHH